MALCIGGCRSNILCYLRLQHSAPAVPSADVRAHPVHLPDGAGISLFPVPQLQLRWSVAVPCLNYSWRSLPCLWHLACFWQGRLPCHLILHAASNETFSN